MAASRPTHPTDDLVVSQLRSLPAEERNRRLIQAATEGVVAELEALLDAGADVAAKEVVGFTAGDGNLPEFLSGSTALHHAVAGSHVEAVRRLLARGAPVDATNCLDWTPLHCAAFSGNVEVARLLLAASAKRSAKDWMGQTPLRIARGRNNQQVADLLSGR